MRFVLQINHYKLDMVYYDLVSNCQIQVIFCNEMQGTSYENMTIIVQNYVEGLISKYPYWNRTLGADHFFVTCHDVGVRATEGLPLLVKNSIRAVCSPSYDVGFIPHKDIALPQVLQPFALPRGGGDDIENRFPF